MFTIRNAFTPTVTRARARSLDIRSARELRALSTTARRHKKSGSTSQGHVLEDTTGPSPAKDTHSQAASQGQKAKSSAKQGTDVASGNVEGASRSESSGAGSGNQEGIGMHDQVGSQSTGGGSGASKEGEGEAEKDHGGGVGTAAKKVAGYA